MYHIKNNVSYVFLLADIIVLCISVILAIYLNAENLSRNLRLLLMIGLPALWFLIVYCQPFYFSNIFDGYENRLLSFFKACFILLGLLCLIYSFVSLPRDFRDAIIAFSIGFPIAGGAANFMVIGVVNRIGSSTRRVKHIVFIDVNKMISKEKTFSEVESQKNKLNANSFGVDVLKDDFKVGQTKIFEDVHYMKSYLEDNHVDEILLSLPIKTSKKVREILRIADYHGARVKLLPDYKNIIQSKCKTAYASKAISVRPMPLDNSMSNFLKEAFDLIFSSVMLVVLLPLFLLIAILIKLESPRPIFYCPIRVGRGNRPFKLYKFCTMRVSDPTNGGVNSTQKNDPRVTKLGRIMRKYSIDELPQFINVFLGDMSVIGPRPHRTYLSEEFQKSEANYMIRHYYKPGITGWAQVNGWRGPTDTAEKKRQRTLHDLWYLENWSFKLDIKIIWMTIFGKKTHDSAF